MTLLGPTSHGSKNGVTRAACLATNHSGRRLMKILKPTANPEGRSERRTRSPRACASAGVRADDTSRTHRAMVASYSPVAVDGSSPSSRATWRWNCRNQIDRGCVSEYSGFGVVGPARRSAAATTGAPPRRPARRRGASGRRATLVRSPKPEPTRVAPADDDVDAIMRVDRRARARTRDRETPSRSQARTNPSFGSLPNTETRERAHAHPRRREVPRHTSKPRGGRRGPLPGQRDEHHSRRFREIVLRAARQRAMGVVSSSFARLPASSPHLLSLHFVVHLPLSSVPEHLIRPL